MKENPLILVSNDDGYEANGVRLLVERLMKFGKVVAICPDRPRSGQSMAITVNDALRVTALPDIGDARMYKANGTPVDCVKLAMHSILERCPDLIVAGINHGSNASVNVLYSGTMGAVMEGCTYGIPSIGFSLTDHSSDADFSGCWTHVDKLISGILTNGLPDGICLNVNIPHGSPYPKEMRLVRACKGKWSDEYETYIDPHGKEFYWLTGKFINEEPDAMDTDDWCLHNGIVSVVPVAINRTIFSDSIPSWLKALK